MKQRTLGTLLLSFLLIVFTFLYGDLGRTPSLPPSGVLGADTGERAKVARVVDGDTIVLNTGQKVRYIGMNTPETVDPRKPVQCFGKEASAENKTLVGGKMVRIVKDVSETDRYGRLLRYVYVQTDNGEIFVNETLVREGYARATSYPPDIAKQDIFRAAEQDAREHGRGLWSTCQ